MRARAVLLIALVIGLGPAGTARAEDPVAIDSAITDDSGVLGSDTSAADAVADLRSETGIVLSAVFVDTFDGESDDADWARQTATESDLGDQEVLLAVATDEVEYEYWLGDGSELDTDGLETLIGDEVEPRILDEDWSGAVVALAEGLGSNEVIDPGMTSWSPLKTTVVVIVLGGALAGLYLLSRRGTSRTAPTDRPQSG